MASDLSSVAPAAARACLLEKSGGCLRLVRRTSEGEKRRTRGREEEAEAKMKRLTYSLQKESPYARRQDWSSSSSSLTRSFASQSDCIPIPASSSNLLIPDADIRQSARSLSRCRSSEVVRLSFRAKGSSTSLAPSDDSRSTRAADDEATDMKGNTR